MGPRRLTSTTGNGGATSSPAPQLEELQVLDVPADPRGAQAPTRSRLPQGAPAGTARGCIPERRRRGRHDASQPPGTPPARDMPGAAQRAAIPDARTPSAGDPPHRTPRQPPLGALGPQGSFPGFITLGPEHVAPHCPSSKIRSEGTPLKGFPAPPSALSCGGPNHLPPSRSSDADSIAVAPLQPSGA